MEVLKTSVIMFSEPSTGKQIDKIFVHKKQKDLFFISVLILVQFFINLCCFSDKNGFIDFKEFLLAIDVTSSGTPEQKLNWAFK